MLDDRGDTPSSFMIDDSRVWNRASNMAGWSAYLDGDNGTVDVSFYTAPARATDLGGLPRAIITVGSLDMFLDENITYAQAVDDVITLGSARRRLRTARPASRRPVGSRCAGTNRD